jgi:RNA polymerase sigma-70 factor (ECF subfamily)
MEDNEIVGLIQKGDKEQFRLIIERYQGKLMAYLRNMINQREEEVEDLLAEVMIKAYENIQSVDTGKKFSSWIYRIAHNQAVDYFKKRKIKAGTIDDKEEIIVSNEKLLEEIEIDKEKNKLVWAAVEGLELKYKEAIILAYFEDRSYDEISDILHISTTNVGVLLFRAKKILKNKLTGAV